MSVDIPLPVLTPADFASDQDVRWCPGCGDYSILAQMKKVLPTLGIPREKIVFISGIGCSSRFPYYMNTYGIHSIHGRAPAVATGLKSARPDLSVWVITGDGDGLSIGGNHLMHAIRRNLDINIVLFNNRIYGLTKGQYSPTSPLGKVTKSTPMGAIDNPLHPLSIAIGCEATFVARIDRREHQAPGRGAEAGGRAPRARRSSRSIRTATSSTTARSTTPPTATSKADTTLELEHGKPLIFGKNRDKGIRLNGMDPEVVELGKGITEDDLLFHDEKAAEPSLAYLLSRGCGTKKFPRADRRVPLRRPPAVRRDGERAGQPVDQRARRGRPEQAVQFGRYLAGCIVCANRVVGGSHQRVGAKAGKSHDYLSLLSR